MRTFRLTVVAPAILSLIGCGGSPSGPAPIPDAPAISCPASVSVISQDGAPVTVSFGAPVTTGGQAPVTVSCSATSGQAFPLGSNIVTCSATDARSRTASCTFSVTVAAIPKISKTRFLAFGDSITYGRCGPAGEECPADAYPVWLATLLRDEYTTQSFTVTNAGVPGEVASDDISEMLIPPLEAGQDRIDREISNFNPEVVLLMEGTNDLFHLQHDPPLAVSYARQALDRMVSIVKGRGKAVLLATIPPQRCPPPPGSVNRCAVAANIPVLNAEIMAIAAAQGVPVVDVYSAMVNDIPSLISNDNLHPTPAGLHVIGDTFFAAIQAAFDVTPTGQMSLAASGLPPLPGPAGLLPSPVTSSPELTRRRPR